MFISQKMSHPHPIISRNLEKHMFCSQARFKNIGVLLMMLNDSRKPTVMEKKLMQANTSKTWFALKIWRALLTDSTTSKKTNTAHTSENRWAQVIREFMTGQRRLIMEICNSVFLVKVLTVQRKWYSQKMCIWVRLSNKRIFIEKLMATLLQENKNQEIIIGNSIQQSTDLGTEKREFSMELQRHWSQRDMMMISQKL